MATKGFEVMKLAIVGSRTFTDKAFMMKQLMEWKVEYGSDLAVVSGGAKGADSIAESLAWFMDIPVIIYKPDWKKFGKQAGYLRNVKIVEAADALLAFYGPEGESKGTAHSVSLARQKGIPVSIFYQQEGT